MQPRHGTRYEEVGGRLASIVDRTGRAWARLAWDAGGRLVRLAVPGAVLDGAVVRDALLGDAHAIFAGGGGAGGGDGRDTGDTGAAATGAPLTTASAIDWARPTEIPIIAAPGRLPPGAGGALLDAIAVLAARAGVPALRYAGPYPTPALWRALGRSFRAAEGATEAAFTADLLERAARLARDPIPIDFAPAPCERVAIAGGHVELREGVERAVIDGVAYEPGGSPARLVALDAGALDAGSPGAGAGGAVAAELWFGDAPYARVAALAADGTVTDGPHPVPPCTSAVVGAEFPPALGYALAQLVAQAVPAPLAADAASWIAARPIRWADLGARVATADAGELRVHAALWDRIGPLGLGRLALALAEALAPVAAAAVAAAAVEELARRATPSFN